MKRFGEGLTVAGLGLVIVGCLLMPGGSANRINGIYVAVDVGIRDHPESAQPGLETFKTEVRAPHSEVCNHFKVLEVSWVLRWRA